MIRKNMAYHDSRPYVVLLVVSASINLDGSVRNWKLFFACAENTFKLQIKFSKPHIRLMTLYIYQSAFFINRASRNDAVEDKVIWIYEMTALRSCLAGHKTRYSHVYYIYTI